jgi:photosystem II stability/assembly factor-like uncharacterized protein
MDPATMPQYGQWRSSMIGGGGWVQNVVFTSDPMRLYAYVDVAGYFRSDDGGRHWRMMHGHLPNKDGYNCVRGLSVDPRNPDRILVVCGNHGGAEPMGIFLSDDGGMSVTQVLTARFGGNAEWRYAGFIIARDPQDPDRLLAGSIGDGMYRSADGGKTWTLAGDATKGIDFTDVKIDRTDASKAFACAQKLNVWIAGTPAESHFGGGFFTSHDGGKSWTRISDTAPSGIVQDPRSSRLYGIFDFGSSYDGGIAIRASDDGGATWKEFKAGLSDIRTTNPGPGPSRYDSFAAGPDFVILASAYGDFYRLASGQDTWQFIERHGVDYRDWTMTNRTDIPSMCGSCLSSVSIDPRHPEHWFFTDAFAIYETTDAAQHWTLRVDGLEATVCHALCQDPSDPGRVHLGMADNGYFNSQDGGSSFQLQRICSNVKDIALSPKLPSRVYAVGTGAWEWASNQVFVSSDGGDKWSRSSMIGLPDMKTARCNTIAVNPADPYECFLAVSGPVAAGGGGPYRSTDGGKRWQWIGDGLPEPAQLFPDNIWIIGRQLAVGPGGEVMCVGNGTIYRLDRAMMQWKPATACNGVGTIEADPHHAGAWIAAGDSGIYRVSGSSAERVYTSTSKSLVADQVVPGRFAATVNEGIMLSTDSGATWHLLDDAIPQKQGGGTLAFAGDRLVAGIGGSGVFWIPLAATAAQGVHARPIAPAPQQPVLGQLPALDNLDFSQGAEYPAHWSKPTADKGTGSATRDTAAQLDGAAMLRLHADAPATLVTIRQDFIPTGDEFIISGSIRIEGQSEATISLQVFDGAWKQIAWMPVADCKVAGDHQAYSTTLAMPASAAHAGLILQDIGNGTVWFGGIRLAPSPVIAHVPALENLDFSAGEAYPAHWSKATSEKGTISAARDTTVRVGGTMTLRLHADAPGSAGNVRQDFPASLDEFTLSGAVSIEGSSEAVITIQVFDAAWKQIDWITVADVKKAGGNQAFSSTITLPGAAAHAGLILASQGDGTVWFGGLKLTPSLPIFH